MQINGKNTSWIIGREFIGNTMTVWAIAATASSILFDDDIPVSRISGNIGGSCAAVYVNVLDIRLTLWLGNHNLYLS